ncbi:hypothetical protein [Microvirga zambiensis]|uniref:hypothetical protein n=1 Tax=Microvirga zambiensis TaxID=1402137 RepID=UPI00191FEDED|nr:hypothetical protein [Microvirga zambiensis]
MPELDISDRYLMWQPVMLFDPSDELGLCLDLREVRHRQSFPLRLDLAHVSPGENIAISIGIMNFHEKPISH